MVQAPSTSSSRIQRRLWKAGRLERVKGQPGPAQGQAATKG